MTRPRNGHPSVVAEPGAKTADLKAVGRATTSSSKSSDGSPGLEQQALRLRESGRSYPAIARELGLSRSGEARSAFVRAVRQRPKDERTELFQRESHRLDTLEQRVRGRDSTDRETMERRLTALAKLRKGLE